LIWVKVESGTPLSVADATAAPPRDRRTMKSLFEPPEGTVYENESLAQPTHPCSVRLRVSMTVGEITGGAVVASEASSPSMEEVKYDWEP
jgi:hypothetical protein